MHDDILAILEPFIQSGQRTLEQTMRRLLELTEPELSAQLPQDSPAFLEPTLFLHFSGLSALLSASTSRSSAAQWIAGYLPADGGRICFVGETDGAGRLHVPMVGDIVTPHPCSCVRVVRDGRSLTIRDGETQRPVDSEPPLRIGPGSIQLYRHSLHGMDQVFVDECGRLVDVEIEESATTRAPYLVKAFDLIAHVWPRLYLLFGEVVKRIVIFRSMELNSFATPRMHGVAFLNAALGRDEIFFLEDLAHQCGHVVLTAALQQPEDWLLRPPSDTVGQVIGRDDHRSLIVALHGLVTEALMTVALDRCLSLDLVPASKRHELIGRLAFVAMRFGHDAQCLSRDDLFTETGQRLLRALCRVLRDVVHRRRQLLVGANFANQSYNFDYARYRQTNPSLSALSIESQIGAEPS